MVLMVKAERLQHVAEEESRFWLGPDPCKWQEGIEHGWWDLPVLCHLHPQVKGVAGDGREVGQLELCHAESQKGLCTRSKKPSSFSRWSMFSLTPCSI